MRKLERGKRANQGRTCGKKDGGKRRERKRRPRLITYEVLCLVSTFFFLIFFKHRKTAFGLNLKEAETGMAVALAGNSL